MPPPVRVTPIVLPGRPSDPLTIRSGPALAVRLVTLRLSKVPVVTQMALMTAGCGLPPLMLIVAPGVLIDQEPQARLVSAAEPRVAPPCIVNEPELFPMLLVTPALRNSVPPDFTRTSVVWYWSALIEATASVAPLPMVIGALRNPPVAGKLRFMVPSLTVIAPVYPRLTVVQVTAPDPTFSKPPVPVTRPLRVMGKAPPIFEVPEAKLSGPEQVAVASNELMGEPPERTLVAPVKVWVPVRFTT